MSESFADEEEKLYRQIPSHAVVDGVPSSEQFRPAPKDDDKLSVDRGARCSAEVATMRFLENGFSTVGAMSVLYGEFFENNIPCIDDPIDEKDIKNPDHALADYSVVPTQSKKKTIAKKLKRKAVERGWEYQISKKED